MDIHTLIEQILRLKNAEVSVGQGLKDSAGLDLLFQQYLTDFPMLNRDHTYIEFIKHYAGMHIYKPSVGLSLDIFGFTNASSTIEKVGNEYLLWRESNIVEGGFLVFCDTSLIKEHSSEEMPQYPDYLTGAGFAFDITGHHESGIYRTKNAVQPFEWYWYCDTFLTWLKAVVEYSGNLPVKIK
jgi:hypothetical protein